MQKYGIVYGAEGRSEYLLDGPFNSLDEAKNAYDSTKLYEYEDGVIGGADLVELFENEYGFFPWATIEILKEEVKRNTI